MAQKWVTVAQAAKALGISATTVRRRAQREELESRLGPEGWLEIRLAAPADEAEQAQASTTASATTTSPAPSEAAPDATSSASAGPEEGQSNDDEADDGTDVDTEVEQIAAPNPGKFGNYSPLPHGDAGIVPGGSPTGRPTARLTPSELLSQGDDTDSNSPEAELRRYQRLAGASMILAQRQADEAHEQVSLIRAESHAWRRWCQGAWAGVAVVVLLAMFVVGIVGHRASSAQAALQVQQQALETAREAAAHNARERDDLHELVRQLQRQHSGNNANNGRDRNAAVR